jgi:ATP phosphoribosyltransferase
MTDTLTIAVSKGRIFEEALPLLAHAGVEPLEDPQTSRKLIIGTSRPDVRLVIIRATDVPPYVEYGGADLGIAGKDVLMEYEGSGLYEPLDLDIARCRMMVAGPAAAEPRRGRLRVATKYVKTARAHYAGQGRQVEIIKLYGSMELAPLVGMADQIVDLVSTGRTLSANGLVPLAHIADISSRLVVNKAAMKMKHGPVTALVDRLAEAVERRRRT